MPESLPGLVTGVYVEAVYTIREFLAGLPNLYLVGRNGMHKYNNHDHSMLTAMLSVKKNILGANYDVWGVNVDNEYHEEMSEQEESDTSVGVDTTAGSKEDCIEECRHNDKTIRFRSNGLFRTKPSISEEEIIRNGPSCG